MKRQFALLGVLAVVLSLLVLPARGTGNSLGEWYTLTFGLRPSLYQADKSTGALSLIGTATQDIDTDGLTGVSGFDIDATNNKAYFVTYGNVPGALWEIDLGTGLFTYIADTTAVIAGNPVDVGNVTAFDLGPNGEAWIAADNFGFGRVNLATGEVTLLIDDFTFPYRIHALATSPDGQLYAFDSTNSYYTVDTGASPMTITKVGSTGLSIKAADFDADGTLLTQAYSGQLSKLTLSDSSVNSLFTMQYSGSGISSEAFAVGGPTDGKTLTEALAAATPPADPSTQPVPQYTGPIVTEISKERVSGCGGDELILFGERLDVTGVSIQGKEAQFEVRTRYSVAIRVPGGLSAAEREDVVLESKHGRLTLQDLIEVEACVPTPAVWTKRIDGDRVRVYVKHPYELEDLRIELDGENITESAERHGDYLIAEVPLKDRKNRFGIFSGEERLWRTTYCPED